MILAQRIDVDKVELLVDQKTRVHSTEYVVYKEDVVPDGFVGSLYIVEFQGTHLEVIVNNKPLVILITNE